MGEIVQINCSGGDFLTSPAIRLFESQAERFADRTAIQTLGDSVTYNELNNLANRVAIELIGRPSFRPETSPVAILMPQGIAAVASMLGVLKAGGFFVP